MRSLIELLLATSSVKFSIFVSVTVPTPSSERTAAAKFASGIVKVRVPVKLLVTSVTSRILTVPSPFTSVRRSAIELPLCLKAAVTRAVSVASTTPSSLTSHGGYAEITISVSNGSFGYNTDVSRTGLSSRNNDHRFVKPNSGRTSLTELSASDNHVRFVNPDKSLISLMVLL